MIGQTCEYWVDAFNKTGLMCAKVNNYDDVLNDEHCQLINSFTWIEQAGVGKIPVVNPPGPAIVKANDSRGHAPNIGEHSSAVLEELGYSQTEIKVFSEAGVVNLGLQSTN